MKQIQKCAPSRSNGLGKIQDGLRALRNALRARAPQEFDVWFTFAETEVQAGWSDRERPEIQDYLSAPTVAELLVKWQAVQWWAELRRAKEDRRSA